MSEGTWPPGEAEAGLSNGGEGGVEAKAEAGLLKGGGGVSDVGGYRTSTDDTLLGESGWDALSASNAFCRTWGTKHKTSVAGDSG